MAIAFPAPIFKKPKQRLHEVFESVLGTSLEIQLLGENKKQLDLAKSQIFAKIDRLENVFSRYKPTSQLNNFLKLKNKWVEVSPELFEVLKAAQEWQHKTQNAFHCGVESLATHWRLAEKKQSLAEINLLANTLRSLQDLQISTNELSCSAKLMGDCDINLNAIAKGFIADHACKAAFAVEGISDAMVNLGGDLMHLGNSAVGVSITDPFSKADNAKPLTTIQIQNAGMATSGHTQRGYQIHDQWYSHILDPRTGYPIQHIAQATVIAETVQTADVFATALCVLDVEQGLKLANSIPEIACCVVETENKQVHCNKNWQEKYKGELI